MNTHTVITIRIERAGVLAETLKINTSIKHLDLSVLNKLKCDICNYKNSFIRDEGVRLIAEALKTNTSLSVLNLFTMLPNDRSN